MDLQKYINSVARTDYNIHSRIHKLHSLKGSWYIKRDDELSCSISGTKMRKYYTLIAHLIQKKIKQVIVIGGAHSNNVFGLIQLLKENQIQPILFLLKDQSAELNGNSLWIQLMCTPKEIHWFEKNEWPHIEEKAALWAEKNGISYIIPEGAICFEALPGALTLALDIARNEKESGLEFHHILIEAGTGFTAIALLLGLSFLQKKSNIDILLLYDSPEVFQKKLRYWHNLFQKKSHLSCPMPSNFSFLTPAKNRSFGSTSSSLFRTIGQAAQNEGVLFDPIYSAKLFECAQTMDYTEDTLLIHSGGTLSLFGFRKELLKITT